MSNSSAKICILSVITPSSFAPSYAFTPHFVSGPAQLLTSWVLTSALNGMYAFDLNEKFLQKQGVNEVAGFPVLDLHIVQTSNPATRPPGQAPRTSRHDFKPKNVTAPKAAWGLARFVQA